MTGTTQTSSDTITCQTCSTQFEAPLTHEMKAHEAKETLGCSHFHCSHCDSIFEIEIEILQDTILSEPSEVLSNLDIEELDGLADQDIDQSSTYKTEKNIQKSIRDTKKLLREDLEEKDESALHEKVELKTEEETKEETKEKKADKQDKKKKKTSKRTTEKNKLADEIIEESQQVELTTGDETPLEISEEDMQEVLFEQNEENTENKKNEKNKEDKEDKEDKENTEPETQKEETDEDTSSDGSIIADIGISFSDDGEIDALTELADAEELLEEEELDLTHLSKSIEKNNSGLEYESRIKSMKTEAIQPSEELQNLLDPLKGVKVEKQDSLEPKVKPPSFSDIKGATAQSGLKEKKDKQQPVMKAQGIRPQGSKIQRPKAQRIKPKGTITNSRADQRRAAQQSSTSILSPKRLKPDFSSVSGNPLLSYFVLPTIGLLFLLGLFAVLIVNNPISTSNTLKAVASNVPSIAPTGVFIETIEFDKTELDNGEYLIVIDGTVSNIREDASFTDVVIEAQAYDKNGSLLTSESSILGQGLNVLGKSGITAKSRHFLKLYQEKKEGMSWTLPALGKRTFTIGLFSPDARRAAYFSARIFSVSYMDEIVSQKDFSDEIDSEDLEDSEQKSKRTESEKAKRKRNAPPLKRFRTKAKMQQ